MVNPVFGRPRARIILLGVDIDKKGEAYCVTDGLLRANFAKVTHNEDILLPGSGIEVLPDIP